MRTSAVGGAAVRALTFQTSFLPFGAAAGPLSVLFARISPSVISVRTPSSVGMPFVLALSPALPAEAAIAMKGEDVAPDVKAGASSLTEPSERRISVTNGVAIGNFSIIGKVKSWSSLPVMA